MTPEVLAKCHSIETLSVFVRLSTSNCSSGRRRAARILWSSYDLLPSGRSVCGQFSKAQQAVTVERKPQLPSLFGKAGRH